MNTTPSLPAVTVIGTTPAAAGIAKRLVGAGVRVGLHDEDAASAERLAAELGAQHLPSFDALPQFGAAPRVIWMVLDGKPVAERTLADLAARLGPGDVVVDAGEGDFRDSAQHARALQSVGIGYADVALANGDWTTDAGRVLAVGGQASEVETLRPHLDRLAPAPQAAWGLCGPPGSGRFVKAVEQELGRGVSGAWAEGLELFGGGGFRLQPVDIARVWQRGGALNAKLGALASDFLGAVGWTPQSSGVAAPPPALALALSLRFAARGVELYLGQLSALMEAAARSKNGA